MKPIFSVLLLLITSAAFSQYFYDGSGHQVGRTDGNNLFNGSGKQVGRLDGDYVYDGSGHQIGRADGLRRIQIIIFFYFFY